MAQNRNAGVKLVSGAATSIRNITTALDEIDLDDLRADIAKQQVRGQQALNVVREAPAMLGGDGKRVYFIAFLTPAEIRGGGGFMGNWAELTIDNGKIKMTGFGRHTTLYQAGIPDAKAVTGPAGWIEHWASYGILRANLNATPVVWSNITISPNFPDTAQVISQLYPQSGGQRLDGVISMDQSPTATTKTTAPTVGTGRPDCVRGWGGADRVPDRGRQQR